MDFATAGTRYSLLSVGDGLVALIPSLMVSIAAGMIVTRVGKGGNESNSVASDMARELVGNSKALLIAVVFALAFAVIPGMPSAVFVGMALSLAVPWYFLRHALLSAEGARDAQAPVAANFHQRVEDIEAPPRIRPLIVQMSAGLSASQRGVLENISRTARNRLLEQYGVSIPKIEFRQGSNSLAHQASIYIHEVPMMGFSLLEGKQLVCQWGDQTDADHKPVFERMDEPLRGSRLYLVKDAETVALSQRGYQFESHESYLVELVVDCLLTHAKAFFSAQELSNWLTSQEALYPDVVKELQRVIPNTRLHEILLRLLSERVSILNFEAIASCLTEWSSRERDLVILSEHVRMALAPQICHAVSHEGVVHGYVISPELEATVRQALRQTATGSYLDLDDETRNALIRHIHESIPYRLASGAMPVLLAPSDCRRYVRRLYDQSITWLQVLSFSEVPPHVSVNVVGEVGGI
jgi:type III secretion protein V